MSMSMSMSIQNYKKTENTPGYQRYANPEVIEFQQIHLTVPRLFPETN